VNKVVNLASRCAGFINKKFDGQLSADCGESDLLVEFMAAGNEIAEHYEQREFGKAIRHIMALADKANQYVDDKKPWALAKGRGQRRRGASDLFRRSQHVPTVDDLPETGAACVGAVGRGFPCHSAAALARPRSLAARAHDQTFPGLDATHRKKHR
jgi:hypothetical protein